MVTGGYKRGVPFKIDERRLISCPGGDLGLGQDVFQESLVPGTDLVEFVDIDQGKAVEGEFCVFFPAEIDPVGIKIA